MVRDFQSVIGREALSQMTESPDGPGRLPDAIVACVGGGSNAIGIFHPFLDHHEIRLIGVEAGGLGIDSGAHAARFADPKLGRLGILQGTKSFVLQDDDGQIALTHSISAGLDYASVGPEHAWLTTLAALSTPSARTTKPCRASNFCANWKASSRAGERHAIGHLLELAADGP